MEIKLLSDFVKSIEAKGMTIKAKTGGIVCIDKQQSDQGISFDDIKTMQKLNKKGDLHKFLKDIGAVDNG